MIPVLGLPSQQYLRPSRRKNGRKTNEVHGDLIPQKTENKSELKRIADNKRDNFHDVLAPLWRGFFIAQN